MDNSFFLSNLSARKPAMGGAKKLGDMAAKVTTPTHIDEPEMLYTSHPLDTISAQLAAPAKREDSHSNLKSE